jgi:hypothetical protein
VVLVVLVAGCMGSSSGPGPLPSASPPVQTADGSDAPSAPINELPIPSIQLTNATRVVTTTHFVGERIEADGRASKDPDGRIQNYTWRVVRNGVYEAKVGALFGANVSLKFAEPGDRDLVLQVRDNEGASQVAYRAFSVHQHRIEAGTIVLSTLPAGGVRLPLEGNFSLPIRAGLLALSINATFKQDETSKVHVDIRAPNGAVLAQTESGRSPLWAIAPPVSGVVGNYTAHIRLVAGTTLDYRLEYVAWYGYY